MRKETHFLSKEKYFVNQIKNENRVQNIDIAVQYNDFDSSHII